MKIAFLGAGSTVFARNILGDCIVAGSFGYFEIALYDIDPIRLKESYKAISAINRAYGEKATIIPTLDRITALKNADFVVNAIQVGGYKPSTVRDFEIPKKYGLRQTIADTLGIGGIFRGLRTIPVMKEIADDMEKLCPDALFLNYTNPMAILSGYMNKYTKIKTIGLCHSVQSCTSNLFNGVHMQSYIKDSTYKIYGINHQAWLLEVKDCNGNDLYPTIKKQSRTQKAEENRQYKHDLVRHEIMNTFGYYTTESSEHASEYLPYFIKRDYPELIQKYNIPLDEYPRRCRAQIRGWKVQKLSLLINKRKKHTRSHEFGSFIMEAGYTGKEYNFHGNILNNGLIPNLPNDACVEVPITIIGKKIITHKQDLLPSQCAAINNTNIATQLLTIEAAHNKSKELIYMAAMLDPHTSSELSPAKIKALCDELYDAHRADGYLPDYN